MACILYFLLQGFHPAFGILLFTLNRQNECEYQISNSYCTTQKQCGNNCDDTSEFNIKTKLFCQTGANTGNNSVVRTIQFSHSSIYLDIL